MSIRKPPAAKASTGTPESVNAGRKTASKAAGKNPPAAKSASGARQATAPQPAAAAKAKGPAGSKSVTASKPAGGTTSTPTGAGKAAAAGKSPGGKGGKSVRDESRSPASLARAAMLSAERAREAAKPKKSPYSKTQLAPMRKALLELRTRIIGDINQMEKEALRAEDADVDDDNVADHGTDAFERNMTLGLMEGEARTLRMIGEALDGIEAGRYGLCSGCGEAIPIARLEALPFAGTCIPCQETQERRM